MPGGTEEAYKHIEDIVRKVAAQVDDGPCVTYVGNGGAGNFVKMVHNGIEYGDMQLISEAYDILKTVGGFSNEELAEAFDNWNKVSGSKLPLVPAGYQQATSRLPVRNLLNCTEREWVQSLVGTCACLVAL